jgi:hypothetical protein
MMSDTIAVVSLPVRQPKATTLSPAIATLLSLSVTGFSIQSKVTGVAILPRIILPPNSASDLDVAPNPPPAQA